MGLRYKFKQVVVEGNQIYAVFDKGGRDVFENEKGCWDLYEQTLRPNAKSSSSLADPRSRPDIEEGFKTIRQKKISANIPFESPDLPLDPGW